MSSAYGPLAGFGVAVCFVGTEVVLSVRGEVDLLTAPELRAVLDTVIDRGHRSVVLDLAELDFMDAAGLSVIAAAVRRLGLSGRLGIRSPSNMVPRILDLTGLTELVQLDKPSLHTTASSPNSWSTCPGSPAPVPTA